MWQYEGFEPRAIHEPWLIEWVAFGIAELESYLGKWRRFAQYLESESAGLVENA